MNKISRVVVLSLVAVLGVGGMGKPAAAEEGGHFFTARRTLGLVFLGGSAALVKQGIDFHDEADELYARYEMAGTADEADRLYARTNNRDIKAQVSWALAAAFAVSGVRLILQGGSAPHAAEYANQRAITPGVVLEPRLSAHQLGLVIKRSFF